MIDSKQILSGFLWYGVFVFSTCMHEAAHAATALRLGDSTAHEGGQVSMNPAPHIRREPFGMILVPLLSYFSGGWMIGWASAPYNIEWARMWPRRAALMALAGPTANLSLFLLSGLLIRIGVQLGIFVAPSSIEFIAVTQAPQAGLFNALAMILSLFFSLNLILFCFNLLPLPPLDGSGAATLLMNESAARRFQDFVRQPPVMIIALIVAWTCFGYIFRPILLTVVNVLYFGIASYSVS